MRKTVLAGTVTVAVLVVFSIWLPVLHHYYEPRQSVSQDIIDKLRVQPSSTVMNRLATMYLGVKTFDTTGLPAGGPTDLLRINGLFDVSDSLREYRKSGNQVLLDRIVDDIIQYADRANEFFPLHEFMWNDHAISNRVFVFASFWQVYRQHPDYNAEVANAVIEHVARNVQYLMREDHYTFSTNHGMMQSIALLHAANSFPSLAGREEMVDLALIRLTGQMEYYVSGSGWVMEHSASYQEFGVELLKALVVEMDILGRPIPDSWKRKLDRSISVLDLLVRPDSSIPNFGSSYFILENSTVDDPGCRNAQMDVSFWPAEGYLVDWDSSSASDRTECAQTVVVWPDFVSAAHKRDNELSIHYWADGVDFVKSSGYWPYGHPSLQAARGWLGSNAPHFAGESSNGGDKVESYGLCRTDDVWFIDLERKTDDGAVVRRQVVGMGADGILILDTAMSHGEHLYRSIWRLDPRIRLVGSDGTVFQAGDDRRGVTHTIAVAGADVSAASRIGSDANTLLENIAASASLGGLFPLATYVVSSEKSQATLVSIYPNDSVTSTHRPTVETFESDNKWAIQVNSDHRRVFVERDESALRFRELIQGIDQSCQIANSAASFSDIDTMERKFLEVAQGKVPFRSWVPYRLKATVATVAIAVMQCLLLTLVVRYKATVFRPVWAFSFIGWIAFGSFVHFIYLSG